MSGQDAPALSEQKVLSRKQTLAAFIGSTALSGGVSVLSIPIIVLLTDAHAWGSIALGQAVGSSVGVLAMFGWGVTGPAAVAMMRRESQAAAYWDSILARGLLFVPALVVTVVVTWLLVPSEHVAATLCSVALAFGGLSGSWFLVGAKRPDRLLLFDTLPRVGGTVVGVAGLALTRSLLVFAVCQMIGSLLAFVLVSHTVLPRFRRPQGASQGLRHALRVLGEQRHGVAVAVAIASYYPAVLAIVAAFAPGLLPLYALIEKVLRFAVMAMQPVFQYFQATVPTRRGDDLRHAIRRSLVIATAIGLICWAGFALLLPLASFLLTAGQVDVPSLVAINLGAYMGATVVITFLSTVALIAVSRVSAVGRGALVTSVIGLVIVLALALTHDGAAISWGFVATAVMIIGYELVVLARALPATVDSHRRADLGSESA